MCAFGLITQSPSITDVLSIVAVVAISECPAAGTLSKPLIFPLRKSMCSKVTVSSAYVPPIILVNNISVEAHLSFKQQRKYVVLERLVLACGEEVEYRWLKYINTCVNSVYADRSRFLRFRFLEKLDNPAVFVN